MKTLNLVHPEKSDIKYKVSKFPDGQQQVTIDKESLSETIPGLIEPVYYAHCGIKARLNNFSDLEILICAVKSLRGLEIKNINLYVPYFLGSRSDRKFQEGENNYLKDVICPIINSLQFESVTVMDPHSDVLEGCLDNFTKKDNRQLIEFFIADTNTETFDNVVLVSPDAGANKKIFKIAEKIGFTGPIITCSKDRGDDGKINKTIVPLKNLANKRLIIIDDICDGGATFLNIAKIIKEHYVGNAEPEIYLIVTHGIFSKGFDELGKYFNGIYSTDSYRSIPTTGITSQEEGNHHCVIKQKSIF
jgi:ribose-phosphate pyrophosphokinase